MKHVISFKNLAQIVLCLGVSFSALVACTESAKENKPKAPEEEVTNTTSDANEIMGDLLRWNSLGVQDSTQIMNILNMETVYFSIDSSIISDRSSHIHIYPALTRDNELYFNVITSNEDKDSNYILSSSRNKYVSTLDSNDLNFSRYFDKNNANSPHHISASHAYTRVSHWNNTNTRNAWISNSLQTPTCGSSKAGKLNQVFSVFVMNVEDFQALDEHYSMLAIDDSTNAADLIVINTSTSGNNLSYISKDVVRSIPPCKPATAPGNGDFSDFKLLEKIADNI